jgi:hypothetical protein
MGKSRSPVRGRLCKQPSVEELELVSCQLEPKLEGRILQLTPVSIKGNEHEIVNTKEENNGYVVFQ